MRPRRNNPRPDCAGDQRLRARRHGLPDLADQSDLEPQSPWLPPPWLPLRRIIIALARRVQSLTRLSAIPTDTPPAKSRGPKWPS